MNLARVPDETTALRARGGAGEATTSEEGKAEVGYDLEISDGQEKGKAEEESSSVDEKGNVNAPSVPPFQRARTGLMQDIAFIVDHTKELASTGHITLETHEVYGISSTILIMIGLGLTFVLFFVALGCYLGAYSSGWAWAACVTVGAMVQGLLRMRRGLRRDALPTGVTRTISGLWLIAAFMAFFAACARCSRTAGLVGDFVCDVVFSFTTAFLLVGLHIELYAPSSPSSQRGRKHTTRKEACCTCHSKHHDDCRDHCEYICCWILFVLLMVPLALIACLSIFHSGETLSYAINLIASDCF